MQRFYTQLAQVLHKYTQVDLELLTSLFEIPPDKSLGDIALPCFRFAKEWRKAPQAIAQDIVAQVTDESIIERAVAQGPYVNFYLTRKLALTEVLEDVALDRGVFTSDRGASQTVAVDLSSPNIAKPFSMGHLRSTVIGTAISNLFTSDGYKVLRINHLGDWGTQFGKIIVAYHAWGDPVLVQNNPITQLNALYVKFHEEAVQHPELEDQARATFKRLEDGNEDDLTLWRWMVDVSLAEFARMYELLGTTFTHNLGESFYNEKMDAVVAELAEKNLLVTSDGAEVVMLDDLGLPPCLIRRSDGATLYATRDLAAALYRHKELDATQLFYVVGNEQKLHFQQIFRVLSLLGYDFASSCYHVAFGMMRLDGRKMSTRKGQVVRLEDVLQEAISRAHAIIEEKNPTLPDVDHVAQAIGVGAVIFNDLKTNRLHDIDFSLTNAVAFDGETGPYVQYTHARACSVLRKANVLLDNASPSKMVMPWQNDVLYAHGETSSIDNPTWNLIKEISKTSATRLRAIDEADPSLIAKHVLDVCQAFNHFYHECPILTADISVRALRLALTDATRIVIRASLLLLGLQYPAEI